MNKERVGRRLDLVGSSAGSIISVAAWCALHAPSADLILAAIEERMRSRETSDSVRCALLHVVHELLLTCAVNGTPEAGKRCVLLAVSRALPAAVAAVRALPGIETAAFEDGLARVAGWWAMLNLFPRAWIAQLGARRDANAGGGHGGGAAMPAQLRLVAGLAAKYAEARDAWQRAPRDVPGLAGAARDEAQRQLDGLRAAMANGALDGGAGLAAWLEAERVALSDGATAADGANTAAAQQGEEDDDVLGSFF